MAICTSEIRKDAGLIVYEKKIKQHNEYIVRLLTYNEDFLDLQLEADIYRLLKRYELRSNYSNVKTLIMQNVVREFFLFILLHIEHTSYMPRLVENAIDRDKIEEYYIELLGGKEKETKFKFYKLAMLYNEKTSEEDAIELADILYEKLENIIKTKYKEKSIAKAQENQKIFELSREQTQTILDLKAKVKTHLQETFAPIMTEYDNKGGIFKLHLLSSNEFTNSVKPDRVNRYYPLKKSFVSNYELECKQKRPFTIVVNSGANGSLLYLKIVNEIMRTPFINDIRLVLLCGNNTNLYEMAKKRYSANSRIEIKMYEEDMAELLNCADICLAKPGANTFFECMYKSVPMLVDGIDGFLYQERGVQQYLEKFHVGEVFEAIDEIPVILQRMISSYTKYEEGIKAIERQNGAKNIIYEIMREEYARNT